MSMVGKTWIYVGLLFLASVSLFFCDRISIGFGPP